MANTYINELKVWISGILLLVAGCNQPVNQQEGDFSLEGSFAASQMDSIRVYMLDGLALRPILSAPITQEGDKYTFEMRGDLPGEGLYFIGQAPRNLGAIILGKEKGVKITGNGMNLSAYMKVENSPSNDLLDEINDRMGDFQQASRSAVQNIRVTGGGDEEIRKELKQLVERQQQYLDSLRQKDPLIAKIFAMSIQEVFDPQDNPEDYPSEMHHFAATILSYADLSDPAFDYLPVSDYVRAYVPQIFGSTIPNEDAQKYFDQFLERFPQGSQAHKNALAAAISAMEQMSADVFPEYGEKYIQLYQPDPAVVQTIQQRSEIIQNLVAEREAQEKIIGIGSTPPPIRLPQPDGSPFEWKSLKGKVVLLDFWASWCRPCRIENPNVVRLYEKYKDQGFEILGVSLDNNRGQWLKAIEQDKLSWEHVSDLNGWRSEAAQDYYVRAIPATFLLDQEGKIIAKNLRGPSLERKLAEMLGS